MNEQNTSKGLNRVFLISSVLGVFPFSYDWGSVVINYRVLGISLLIRVISLAGITYLATYFFWDLVFIPEENIDEICMIIQYWATFACIIYTIWNKTEFKLLNQYCLRIDSEFMKLGISPCYKVKWRWDGLILMLSLSTYLLVPILSRYDTVTINYFGESILEAYVAWQCYAVVQPFVQIVRIVGNKVSKIREIFLTLSQCKRYVNTKDKLESTIRLYDLLCSTSELLMDLFSLQILFVFFLVLLKVIVAAFKLLLAIKTYTKFFDLLTHFLDLTYHTVLCVYITTYCKRTSEEAEEFNSVLNEVMIDEGLTNISENRKLRLHVVMKREISFNALGFLDLNYTLVHSVIAAASTYLVILLQFTEDTPTTPPPVRSLNYPY